MTPPANPRQKSDRQPAAYRPWDLRPSDWRQVLVRTWQRTSDNHLRLIAAGVAYFGFLALIPGLVALVLGYGLVANPRAIANDTLAVSGLLPPGAAQLITDQLLRIVQTSAREKVLGLLGALAIAVWGARKAALMVIGALNIAYHEEEERSFLTVNMLALAIMAVTLLLALLSIIAAMVLFYVERVVSGLSGLGGVLVTIASYLSLGLVAAGAIAVLYRYGPSRSNARWSWLSPGSLFAATAWLFLTFLFGFYVTNFGRYDEVYGPLGGVVVLQLWMYMSSFLLIFGAQLNSELEQQTRADTTDGGGKPAGRRGAYSADHVAAEQETPQATA